MVKTLHLTSSRFFGGPERQMLGLAAAGRELFSTSFASFSENGLCQDFLRRAESGGFSAIELANDTPHLVKAVREIRQLIHDQGIDVLLCHGYKAGLAGWRAARKAGIPVIAVSRGWTGENRKVRFYEWLDRKVLRQMDHVVCVSQAQAEKVRRCGVGEKKIAVIPNSIDISRFNSQTDSPRVRLERLWDSEAMQSSSGQAVPSHEKFVSGQTVTIGAAGRLSPEKGFDLLVTAAGRVIDACPNVRFILFGDGPLRPTLKEQVEKTGLAPRFLLAGFQPELDKYLPALDLFVQSSHTEGMPNVILEAMAAGVPAVATSVGGTAEIIDDGVNGALVPAGSADGLAQAMIGLVNDPDLRDRYAKAGRSTMIQRFGFAKQASLYQQLFTSLSNCLVTSLPRSCM